MEPPRRGVAALEINVWALVAVEAFAKRAAQARISEDRSGESPARGVSEVIEGGALRTRERERAGDTVSGRAALASRRDAEASGASESDGSWRTPRGFVIELLPDLTGVVDLSEPRRKICRRKLGNDELY